MREPKKLGRVVPKFGQPETLEAGRDATLRSQEINEEQVLILGVPRGDIGKTPSISVVASPLNAGANPTAERVAGSSDENPVISIGIPRGETGATPIIAATVGSLPYGSTPTVNISGTNENPTLAFNLPLGERGLPGLNSSGGSDMASRIVNININDWIKESDTAKLSNYKLEIPQSKHGLPATPALLAFPKSFVNGVSTIQTHDSPEVTVQGNIILRANKKWEGICVVASGITQIESIVDGGITQAQLDNAINTRQPRIVFGTTNTAMSTTEKIVSVIGNYRPLPGDMLAVQFSAGHSAAALSLNVNNTGVVQVRLGAGSSTPMTSFVESGMTVVFVRSADAWEQLGSTVGAPPIITQSEVNSANSALMRSISPTLLMQIFRDNLCLNTSSAAIQRASTTRILRDVGTNGTLQALLPQKSGRLALENTTVINRRLNDLTGHTDINLVNGEALILENYIEKQYGIFQLNFSWASSQPIIVGLGPRLGVVQGTCSITINTKPRQLSHEVPDPRQTHFLTFNFSLSSPAGTGIASIPVFYNGPGEELSFATGVITRAALSGGSSSGGTISLAQIANLIRLDSVTVLKEYDQEEDL